MRIVVTRPVEDAGPLKEKLEALGYVVILAPMMEIRPRHGVTIPQRDWQAIAVTSANGIRAIALPERLRGIRTLTVGPQSLSAARAAGLEAEAHGGDVAGLAAFIRNNLQPSAGPILYLSGAETAGDLEGQLKDSGFDCERIIGYDAVPATSLGAVEEPLRTRDIGAIVLYSPRTARIWRRLVEAAGLADVADGIVHLCLSPNVAAVLPESWTRQIAETPNERAMLALLDQISRTR